MQKILSILFFTILFFTGIETNAILLQAPPPIAASALAEKAQALSLNMNFVFHDKECTWNICFCWKNGKTILKLFIDGPLPAELTNDEQSLFTENTIDNKIQWLYITNNDSTCLEHSGTIEDAMGMVSEPLVIDNAIPKKVNLNGLVNLIQDKKIVFYTGAGISAGVVPTMKELLQQLELDQDMRKQENRIRFLKKIILTPQTFVEPMNAFFQACLFGEPTKAHTAITAITCHKNCGLLTENLDLLHQRTGIEPLNHLMPNWLESNILATDLQAIDYIVTVGLASDESGFLKWFKTHNQQGKIVAINTESPAYLSAMDHLLTGNAQEIVPLLCEQLLLSNNN